MNKIFLLVAFLLGFNLVAHAESDALAKKKEAFRIQCEGNFAKLGITVVPNVPYEKVKKVGKETCDKTVAGNDDVNVWPKIVFPMLTGCIAAVFNFVHSDLESFLKHLDLKKMTLLTCDGLQGR